jgi:hypothetical protein
MSYFCQFCDKEMLLEESIVYAHDYITCGNTACVVKATRTAKELAKEAAIKTVSLLVFKSETPEDESTWRVVKPEDYPDSFDDEVMKALLEGFVVEIRPLAAEAQVPMFYCGRKTSQVLRQLVDDLKLKDALNGKGEA